MTLIIILIFASTVALVLGFTSLAAPRTIRRRLAQLSDGSVAPLPGDDGEESSVLAQDRRGQGHPQCNAGHRARGWSQRR